MTRLLSLVALAMRRPIDYVPPMGRTRVGRGLEFWVSECKDGRAHAFVMIADEISPIAACGSRSERVLEMVYDPDADDLIECKRCGEILNNMHAAMIDTAELLRVAAEIRSQILN